MNSTTTFPALMSALLLLAGCASVPSGPSVMALPGSGKSFEQFRHDDAECRQYAENRTGGVDANQAAANAGVGSAVVGTMVGALAGAAMGGRQGAGYGAGAGLLVGSIAGAGAAQSSAHAIQRHYDNVYVQCMYVKGQKVPGAVSITRSRVPAPVAQTAPAMPPPGAAYPPPPGYRAPPGFPAY